MSSTMRASDGRLGWTRRYLRASSNPQQWTGDVSDGEMLELPLSRDASPGVVAFRASASVWGACGTEALSGCWCDPRGSSTGLARSPV